MNLVEYLIEQTAKIELKKCNKKFDVNLLKWKNVEGSKVDLKECTDVIFKYSKSKIFRSGLRIRPLKDGKNCPYRDWTIRWEVGGGYRCEIDKIADSKLDYYFYAWQNLDGSWDKLIVKFNDDVRNLIRKYREDGTFESRKKPNFDKNGKHDGTWLTYLTIEELINCKAILAKVLK